MTRWFASPVSPSGHPLRRGRTERATFRDGRLVHGS